MGGLLGYHHKILSLLNPETQNPHSVYHSPSFIDISMKDTRVHAAISWGIEALPYLAEMIPLGGAADRLHLVDPVTGEELPAAKLRFAGKTLLERLIADIGARENLYFQKYGKKIITPIALMTSWEKKNHAHIEQLLEEHHYFGRPQDSFCLFTQPLVPVVSETGDFLFTPDLNLVMKPGGHGAIWKLALDLGVFAWFEKQGRSKALIRQINNPLAGLDYGLLAFIGLGWKENKSFGFASCPRVVRSAEGVNVVVEQAGKRNLTNIEYCDFAKFGIEDLPIKEGGVYSRFTSNTNLLFVDLKAICKAVQICPFPGLLLNLKKGTFPGGEAMFGRLESTMQNIADVFDEQETFITYNHRHKTISPAKRAYIPGGTLQETPETAFYDLLFASRELLAECRVLLPPRRSLEETLLHGPEFVFLYDPKLGPLYSSIRQKLQGGILAAGSELLIENPNVLIENLHLDGSLIITGRGRCVLRNVTVRNRGVDWDRSRPFWKGDYTRHAMTEIFVPEGEVKILDGVCL
jgi:hypothetical protein